MPQLLNYLGQDVEDEYALNFGTVAVYRRVPGQLTRALANKRLLQLRGELLFGTRIAGMPICGGVCVGATQ